MSTVSEIEAAIEQLPPEEFLELRDWMLRQVEEKAGRMWTPEELGEAAQRMVEEPDPARAQALKEEIMRGFYGAANA